MRHLAIFWPTFVMVFVNVGWAGCAFQRLFLIYLFLPIGTLFGFVVDLVDGANSFDQMFAIQVCMSALNWRFKYQYVTQQKQK